MRQGSDVYLENRDLKLNNAAQIGYLIHPIQYGEQQREQKVRVTA